MDVEAPTPAAEKKVAEWLGEDPQVLAWTAMLPDMEDLASCRRKNMLPSYSGVFLTSAA